MITEARLARWIGVPVERLRDICRTSGFIEAPAEWTPDDLQQLSASLGDWVLAARDEGPEELREMATVTRIWGNSRLLQCKRDNGGLIDVVVRDNREWKLMVGKLVPCWLRTMVSDRQLWQIGCKDPIRGQLPPTFNQDLWLAGG